MAFIYAIRGAETGNVKIGVTHDFRRRLSQYRTHCAEPLEVPYPAPECGYWLIRCKTCHLYFALTAAGRVDDPVSLTVPCDYPELVQ